MHLSNYDKIISTLHRPTDILVSLVFEGRNNSFFNLGKSFPYSNTTLPLLKSFTHENLLSLL